LVLARLSTWSFKKGKREDAFAELDLMLNTLVRDTKGFRGYVSMLSLEDPNASTILTLWQDEESLKASEKGVYSKAINKVQESLEKPPKFGNFRVFSTELFTRPE
jgi:heme-degrading monooxygenase HmoA